MAFVKKTWKDRIVQYANRRLLTKSGGEVEQVTVTRDEGTISEAGDQFNASNMNDLETRVDNGFSDLNAADLPITSGSSTNTKDYIDTLVPKYFDLTITSGTSDGGISPFSYYGRNSKTDANIHNILAVSVYDTQFNNPALAVFYGQSGSTYTFMVYSARSGNVRIRVVYN